MTLFNIYMPINAPRADDHNPPQYFWGHLAEYSMHYRRIPLQLEVQFLCALAHGATGAWSLVNVSSMGMADGSLRSPQNK